MDRHVLLSGYYGFGNAGDEAVCAAVLQALQTHGGAPRVTVLSGNPDATREMHGAAAVPRRKILDILPQTDALIQGGGSLLQDATSAASTFYYLWVIMAARIIRRPVFLYAQGIGPLTRPPVRAAVRTVLNRVQSITVRDRDSKALLAALGVDAPPVYLTADPVWALDPVPAERAALIWERQGLPPGRNTVLFALRHWPGAEGLAGAASEAATRLQAAGRDVALLPMQRPADEDLALDIAGRMPHPAPILRGTYAPADLLALTARAELVVAMRLHALIFAARSGVPVLGISYDPKVDSLLRELGAPAVEARGLTADGLVAAFGPAWEARDASRARLRREADRLRDSALSTARLAREFLEAAG